MTRTSTISQQQDAAGTYEQETFDVTQPTAVVVCAHGNGVRRWDGEKFFYNMAEQYPQLAFMLVDQCQTLESGGCRLNDINIMAARVQSLITSAKQQYPGVPIIVLAHSMGCGIATFLDLTGVEKVIFVTPAAGEVYQALIKHYGEDVVNGKIITSSDGLTKDLSKAYVDSVQGIVWEQRYADLLARYPEVYAFEAAEEEIVGEDRIKHRDMPFAGYHIVPNATHNIHGNAFRTFCSMANPLFL